ncbi:hypothetical protein [Methylobacterium oxalidis]|uniref:Uncharacterized protein n=1 Tax=Methylobacterium oxalidis TaxID=944322 RepID=A0A512JAC7_9HYPH|nr:hypothetical protein [Methylobacterium oxalidis]GEP06865.1 hypothetical protein MOX02_49030 [Methylobacterium oxalidis]GJE34999.1 hypothetical protein LDDCCGHA_5216 [Methylobacterium oxalidis]GLS67583.1 hypothetical protein GCM10007888_59670 [Methylobacterium oxalidis]
MSQTFTATDKLRCAEREVRQRHRVYAGLVASNRMKQADADREIACMEAIAADYRAQAAAEKPDLFAQDRPKRERPGFVSSTGSTRVVVVAGDFAFKIARSAEHRACNLFEERIWSEATPERKEMLCPVVQSLFDGWVLVMRAARPLSDEEAATHLAADTYPDWDYVPGGEDEPFEYKASDWGMLDGRLVALDYSAPAIPFGDEQ